MWQRYQCFNPDPKCSTIFAVRDRQRRTGVTCPTCGVAFYVQPDPRRITCEIDQRLCRCDIDDEPCAIHSAVADARPGNRRWFTRRAEDRTS